MKPPLTGTCSAIEELGTGAAEIEVGQRRIAVFNNHPAGFHDLMLAHAQALVKECADYDQVISVGDYNSPKSSAPYAVVAEVLSGSWLRLLYRTAQANRIPCGEKTGPNTTS